MKNIALVVIDLQNDITKNYKKIIGQVNEAIDWATAKKKQGYILDITDHRYHHEIYLSDARKVAPEKLKTVIRHPIRRC